jgi:hypothetical protein
VVLLGPGPDVDEPALRDERDVAGAGQSLLLADQRTTSAARHYHDMDSFAQHASGAAESFPDFSFIEPDYLWPTTNDDHPPRPCS